MKTKRFKADAETKAEARGARFGSSKRKSKQDRSELPGARSSLAGSFGLEFEDDVFGIPAADENIPDPASENAGSDQNIDYAPAGRETAAEETRTDSVDRFGNERVTSADSEDTEPESEAGPKAREANRKKRIRELKRTIRLLDAEQKIIGFGGNPDQACLKEFAAEFID